MDQLFRIFDRDGDGSIDFKVHEALVIKEVNIFTDTLKEFMIATDMTRSGEAEEKLRWAFKMYDKDGSGKGGVYLLFCIV